MRRSKRLKICLVASAGGHLSELLKLTGCWDDHDVFSITTTSVVEKVLSRFGKTYIVGECNRSTPLKVACVVWRSMFPIFREKPDIIITSGAAIGLICAFLASVRGAKVIWIDSITNVNSISLSGWLVRPFASLVLVQWSHLADKYRGCEYVGCLM